MKKYMIFFDEENILACDEDGYFFAMDSYEALKNKAGDYKTEFTEGEVKTYLKKVGHLNGKTPTDEFVKEYVGIFGHLYGPWSDGYVKGTSRFKQEEKEFEEVEKFLNGQTEFGEGVD